MKTAATPRGAAVFPRALAQARRIAKGLETLDNPAAHAPDIALLGTLDLFHDEDVEYARRLSEAGVPTELHVIEGAYHGFDASEPTAPVSVDFVKRQVDALRRMLAAR